MTITIRAARAALAIIASILFATAQGAEKPNAWRFDCGTADTPVEEGYTRLTAAETYSTERGYGWESAGARSADYLKEMDWKTTGFFASFMKENFNSLNCDGVVCDGDLKFRADVPNGVYRVTVMIGDMTRRIGSMDLRINGALAGERLAAWSCGGMGGEQRRIMSQPNGWSWKERHTVEVKDGAVRIQLSKNQKFWDEQIPYQTKTEQAWENQFNPPPYKRVSVDKAPYYYCGWPFEHNAVMALEIVPDKPLPVIGENDKLRLGEPIASPALNRAIEEFNAEKFADAVKSLAGVKEDVAQTAKAVVALWLAGRPETEQDDDPPLVKSAIGILSRHLKDHPEECELAEHLEQAKHFMVGYDTCLHSGDDPLGEKNHFREKAKSITWYWQVPEGAPLYYQAQLNLARSEHMMVPYFPARGTYREVFKKLEKKFPDNRFVKYHLHETWEPYGDGTKFHDWALKDYGPDVKDAPEWVKWAYPAFRQAVDWSEWWIKFRQGPTGSIGGGWGDDVEIIAVFGYYGLVSDAFKDVLIKGTEKMVNGMWKHSEIDQELGYCVLMADSEHSAEWTGNTLGMMLVLKYGDPTWIERSMKTAKLVRDLWTDYNDKGHRFFRASWFGAAEVSDKPEEMDNFWIDFRAVRPASAVLWYNNNPTIGKLYQELGDAWCAVSLSTERGKPRGVIPGGVSYPDELIGGYGSLTWYGAHEPGETTGTNWGEAGYKEYIRDVFLDAYKSSRDPKYLEPMRLEYELWKKYQPAAKEKKPGAAPMTGLRLQPMPPIQEFGVRQNDRATPTPAAAPKKQAGKAAGQGGAAPKPGSEEWAGLNVKGPLQWLGAKRLMEARQGPLQNDMTTSDVIRAGRYFLSEMKWRYPMHTTESGPTDRVGFLGVINPFIVYTGGRIGGPLLEAGVTYENTTREFAAAVLGGDRQGLRLLYYSLTPDTREIRVKPWHLEPGARYVLRYGPDANDDEKMDSITETREFDFPQLGWPIPITVKPRVNYLLEVDQIAPGKGAPLAPDPALTADDIRYTMGRILARIHNVGSKAARRVEVACYDGDPKNGGELIKKVVLPNIEAPLDLDPKCTTAGFQWEAKDEKPHDIYIVIDPDNKLKDEITDLNNTAHATISAPDAAREKAMLGAPLRTDSDSGGTRR